MLPPFQIPPLDSYQGLFYLHQLTLILTWISNFMFYKVWDEITYSFLNFNSETVDMWEWISNFTPKLKVCVITFPCCGFKLIHFSERDPCHLSLYWIYNKPFILRLNFGLLTRLLLQTHNSNLFFLLVKCYFEKNYPSWSCGNHS